MRPTEVCVIEPEALIIPTVHRDVYFFYNEMKLSPSAEGNIVIKKIIVTGFCSHLNE